MSRRSTIKGGGGSSGSGGGASVGTYANRPAAGTAGSIYIPTDGPVSFVDNGTAWRPLLPGAVLGTQPPAASTFATRVAGASADSTLTDSFGTLIVNSPTSAPTTEAQNTAWVTSKTAALTVTMAMEQCAWKTGATPDIGVGIVFRNNSSGKMLAHMWTSGGAFLFSEYPTVTTAPSTYKAGSIAGNSATIGLKLVDDGTTNITAYVSCDAVTWLEVGQYARNAFNGGGAAAGADQWGIFVRPFSGVGYARILSLSAV